MESGDPPSLGWKDVLTESQKKRIDEYVEKNRSKYKELPGILGSHYAIDEALVKVADKNVNLPFEISPMKYSLVDHPRLINNNLFVLYPYEFDSKQFLDFVKFVTEYGFKVSVDSICSRVMGGNVRIICWNAYAKK